MRTLNDSPAFNAAPDLDLREWAFSNWFREHEARKSGKVKTLEALQKLFPENESYHPAVEDEFDDINGFKIYVSPMKLYDDKGTLLPPETRVGRSARVAYDCWNCEGIIPHPFQMERFGRNELHLKCVECRAPLDRKYKEMIDEIRKGALARTAD